MKNEGTKDKVKNAEVKDIQQTGRDGVQHICGGSFGEVSGRDWESSNKTKAGIQKNDRKLRKLFGGGITS